MNLQFLLAALVVMLVPGTGAVIATLGARLAREPA